MTSETIILGVVGLTAMALLAGCGKTPQQTTRAPGATRHDVDWSLQHRTAIQTTLDACTKRYGKGAALLQTDHDCREAAGAYGVMVLL
uniref:Uncharacterized protein n=1 Tax=mine drainage metagenome TaxID=410659 RepID=E6PP49_9ZZZZ